ncbi:hypothetical protein [Bradyrhizobium sp. LHD-71]|uniref:hypothetical protein n=1 Tax=Bradyrhizobium sp. LHD-71 TaxID=3072141 RepID=UPI00280F6520|nr:hypothetical protein [Bradyrhizobium sp. LHD-71]MDQ8730533.1 hypothetical protein [Bradyrhizobium sp. LHD-71]
MNCRACNSKMILKEPRRFACDTCKQSAIVLDVSENRDRTRVPVPASAAAPVPV